VQLRHSATCKEFTDVFTGKMENDKRASVRPNGGSTAVRRKANKLARMAKKCKRTPKSILKLPDLEHPNQPS
jgi:hypothetical protein